MANQRHAEVIKEGEDCAHVLGCDYAESVVAWRNMILSTVVGLGTRGGGKLDPSTLI